MPKLLVFLVKIYPRFIFSKNISEFYISKNISEFFIFEKQNGVLYIRKIE